MSKLTSKYQVSIPRALAKRMGLCVGDTLAWEATAGSLCARVARVTAAGRSVEDRLRLFDAATARQAARDRVRRPARGKGKGRGWSREELYAR